jgi:hypothetical protein
MCAEPRQPGRLERRGVSVFKLTAPLLSRSRPSSATGYGESKAPCRACAVFRASGWGMMTMRGKEGVRGSSLQEGFP